KRGRSWSALRTPISTSPKEMISTGYVRRYGCLLNAHRPRLWTGSAPGSAGDTRLTQPRRAGRRGCARAAAGLAPVEELVGLRDHREDPVQAHREGREEVAARVVEVAPQQRLEEPRGRQGAELLRLHHHERRRAGAVGLLYVLEEVQHVG